MTTATLTKKYTAVEITFHYENDVTQKQLDNIMRKVNTVMKNAEYEATAGIFSDRYTIRVIITFDVSYGGENKIYDELRSPLTRLIDSHKEPATYGWCNTVFTNC